MEDCSTWGIDGYSRQIVYLSASTNNRSTTLLQLFLQATRIHGWPSIVRSDQGGENIGVARAMILARGMGRASHIAGSSVHNQRIEQLWRDTFRCVCHVYYCLFYEMEECGILHPTNEVHLFCLQYVFLPRINMQLSRFVEGWNHHPLRTERGLSPMQLWTRGMCLATPTVFEQPADFDYGIEPGQSQNPFDAGNAVEIPESMINLSDAQLEYIQRHYSSLADSEYQGLDLYLSLVDVVNAMLS